MRVTVVNHPLAVYVSVSFFLGFAALVHLLLSYSVCLCLPPLCAGLSFCLLLGFIVGMRLAWLVLSACLCVCVWVSMSLFS